VAAAILFTVSSIAAYLARSILTNLSEAKAAQVLSFVAAAFCESLYNAYLDTVDVNLS